MFVRGFSGKKYPLRKLKIILFLCNNSASNSTSVDCFTGMASVSVSGVDKIVEKTPRSSVCGVLKLYDPRKLVFVNQFDLCTGTNCSRQIQFCFTRIASSWQYNDHDEISILKIVFRAFNNRNVNVRDHAAHLKQ